MTKFCIETEALATAGLADDSDMDVTNTQNKSMNTEKRRQDKKKAEREKREKIEEFMLFDIDKNNSTANKENQRLLQSFDIA